MAYYLRFTDSAKADLKRGTSLLDLPSLKNPVILEGLCGFSFCDNEEIEYNLLSDTEIEARVQMYKENVWYTGTPVLYLGEYIKQNPNNEGVIFKAESIYKEF